MTPSSRERITKIGGRRFFIRASKAPLEVKGSTILPSHAKIRDATTGKTIRVYWTKTILPAGTELFLKEFRDRDIFPVKLREAEDAIRQKKVLGIKTPEFVLRIVKPERGWLLAVNRKIPEEVVSCDKLIQSDIPEQEKRSIIRRIKRMGKRLIEANLLPSILRPGHILVSVKKPRRFYLTDNAAGFVPITRNRLILLEALKRNPAIPRPDWDRVHSSFSNFRKYWTALDPQARKEVECYKLQRFLEDIQTRPENRLNMHAMRKKVSELIVELFPESRLAGKIRRGRMVWRTAP